MEDRQQNSQMTTQMRQKVKSRHHKMREERQQPHRHKTKGDETVSKVHETTQNDKRTTTKKKKTKPTSKWHKMTTKVQNCPSDTKQDKWDIKWSQRDKTVLKKCKIRKARNKNDKHEIKQPNKNKKNEAEIDHKYTKNCSKDAQNEKNKTQKGNKEMTDTWPSKQNWQEMT